MFTRRALTQYIANFLKGLRSYGYSIDKAVLFGSYAHGKPTALSDVDLAIWDKKFTGCSSLDIEPFVSLLSQYDKIELHTFSPGDAAGNDPFIAEILTKGVNIHENFYLNDFTHDNELQLIV